MSLKRERMVNPDKKKVDANNTQQKHEGLRQALRAFSFLGGIGIYFVVVVGICVFCGSWIDERFGTGHYGRLAGIFLGFPIAIYSVYRKIKAEM